MTRRQILAITLGLALPPIGSTAAAQTEGPFRIRVESNQVQAPIHAESNLVVVPVFVFDKDAMARVTAEEWACFRAATTAFIRLLPSQPYAQEDCYLSEVRGLTAKDFRVFQDGVPQKLQGVVVEGWYLPARDNMTWHNEDTVTPTGIWSTADLAHLFLQDLVRQVYNLAYIPSGSEPGCHAVTVTVDRPNTRVFARDQYCTGQSPSDPLYGTTYDTWLQNDLASEEKGKIRVSLQAGYFYTERGGSRIQIALEFPWKDLKHSWDLATGTLHASIGVLGMAFGKNGIPAARFSDLLYPSYWPTFLHGGQTPPSLLAVFDRNSVDRKGRSLAQRRESRLYGKDPAWLPTRYETQISLPPGEYDLRVVLSDSREFGTAEVPLHVDGYDGRALGLSSVMLCKRFRDAHVAAVERAAANFAPQYVPLVSKNIEVTPTGDTRFKKGQVVIPYFEIYEPLLASAATTTVQAHFRVIEAKTGNIRDDFTIDARSYEQPGKTVIPMTREILTNKMPKGTYRLEVQATDSAGRSTAWRTANFTVE
jgi:hypothetical protein